MRAIATGAIPAHVTTIAESCILDWAGCALAGAGDPAVHALVDELLTAPDAPCTLVGRSARAVPADAALVNGLAGDVLDFSDCLRVMNGHATATVLPAALAQAEAAHATGAELVRAFVVGVEAAARVGALVGDGVLATPFHPTAVAGPFGAAAATAVLLRLPAERWTTAFGIAATQAAGLADAVGTACKPLHAGLAAAAGVRAARLAARDFGGPPDALRPGGGFLRAHTAAPVGDALEAYAGRFFIESTLLKEHAACQLAHGSIENACALRQRHGFSAADVATVAVRVAESSAVVCGIEAPQSGLEAKFSLPTVVAMALLGIDTGTLAAFDDAVVAGPEIAALAERVTVVGDAALPVAVSQMRVVLRDGAAVEATYDERDVDVDPERRRERVRRKFAALMHERIGSEHTAAIAGSVARLSALADVRVVMERLERPAAPLDTTELRP